eukprot:g17883.t1
MFSTSKIIAEKPYLVALKKVEHQELRPKKKEKERRMKNRYGRVVDFTRVYVAKPDSSVVDKINEALSSTEPHVVLSPGIYRLRKAIVVHRRESILYGIMTGPAMGWRVPIKARAGRFLEMGPIVGVGSCGVIGK